MEKVAIGLGSNLGDREAMLRAAVEKLGAFVSEIRLSSFIETQALLPEDAPEEWDMPFLNAALVGQTDLSPQELLAKLQQIEIDLGRQKQGVWSPRSIDLDILLYDDVVMQSDTLTLPHSQMLARDFVMLPLKEVAADWIHPLTGQRIGDWVRTQIVGIVNVTPDSFSDGYTPEAAIAHARKLMEQGVDMLDIGAESTRPGAVEVSPEAEWQRLEPVLKALVGTVRLSVDTRHASTAAQALALGVDCINDVSAASNEGLINAVAEEGFCDYVLMHSLSVPADKNKVLPPEADAVSEVMEFAKKKIAWLEKKGIARARIIFDVGVGFGKTPQQSLELINRIAEFRVLGVPLYVGHSRKSFLSLFTDAPAKERDELTLKFSRQLAAAGVAYLRVHNVELHRGL